MIVLRKLTFARGGEALVSNASLQIGPGWRVGLTGANGSGKSSFFALFRSGLHAEAGDLDWPASWTVAHVAQDTPALPDPSLEFVLDGDSELREVERQLAAAEVTGDGELIGHLHARLADIGGYAAKARWIRHLNDSRSSSAAPIRDGSISHPRHRGYLRSRSVCRHSSGMTRKCCVMGW